MILKCKVCNSDFTRNGKQAKIAKCCSRKCMGIYFKAKDNVICTNCQKPFHVKQSQIDRYKRNFGIFCSIECSSKYRSIAFSGDANHQYGLKGDKNASFKGEITKKRNGKYIDLMIYVGHEHPFSDRCGRIQYHRYLVEENHILYSSEFFVNINNKYHLLPKFDIHHIDHNHDNNNIENLQVLTRSEHSKIHNMGKKIIRGLDGRILGIEKIK